MQCREDRDRRQKNVDADTWSEKFRAKLVPLKNSLSDERRLREQPDTFNKIRRKPEILRDLASVKLELIREIVDELSAALLAKGRGFERKKIIFDFVNRLPNEKFAAYFSTNVFAKGVREKYPCAFKVCKLLYDKIFSVKIPDEKFFDIMEKYFRIINERHQSNHALADFGEFATAEDLRTFMSAALDEIQNALPAD